jgi:hypothetical protein
MSHVQEDHDEAFLPFVGIIIAELTSATVVKKAGWLVLSYEHCPRLALALLHASRFALRLWLSSMAHTRSLCFGGLIVRDSLLYPQIIVHTPSDLSSSVS